MDRLKKEQDAIDRAQAALDERQARVRLLEGLTDDQKAAIELVFSDEDEPANEERESCPGCLREFLPSGVKRHISATHPDDAERLQRIIDERRAALR